MHNFVIKQQGRDLYWSGSYWGEINDAMRYSKYGAKEQAQWLATSDPSLTLVLTTVKEECIN